MKVSGSLIAIAALCRGGYRRKKVPGHRALAGTTDFAHSFARDGSQRRTDGGKWRRCGVPHGRRDHDFSRGRGTQREIEEAPDPLTIDLSEVARMDTVGAWLVYRTVRDRKAKVVGASPEIQSLLDQVAEADKPVRIHPETRGGIYGVVRELGVWVVEIGRTFLGPARLLRRHLDRLCER